MTQHNYKHWRMETDAEGILWLTFDRQGASVNAMNREVFDEFSRVIDDIAQQSPKAVVLLSGKSKGFIAGADITQFTSLQNSDEAFDLIRQAQLALDKLEALPMPTVAMINGFCLGGGLEVALACRYRVAEESDSTLIGLPEVKLGIHPGWASSDANHVARRCCAGKNSGKNRYCGCRCTHSRIKTRSDLLCNTSTRTASSTRLG
jgi:3-hydroxyacyl-CoA dehydrogenase/enoyl-CoA hydratase/3-hydroxybutyryl-CoA epimerase